jgi:MoxR-like ATPase
MLDTFKVIGRSREMLQIEACIAAHRNVLLEGPVGIGKTFLATQVAQRLKRPFYRIDGDTRYTEQKLTGWFDPPAVLKKGYGLETFIPGPLVEAMKTGGILFINELNRLAEGVQNVLLPAIDEGLIQIPYLGSVSAENGFQVIATQNPKEFVATSHLSEALLDRFELISLHYQTEEEESAIVKAQTQGDTARIHAAVTLIRLTREDSRIRRGASIRAALSLIGIMKTLKNPNWKESFRVAARMSLPNRIEIERENFSDRTLAQEVESLIDELAEKALSSEAVESGLKKKP